MSKTRRFHVLMHHKHISENKQRAPNHAVESGSPRRRDPCHWSIMRSVRLVRHDGVELSADPPIALIPLGALPFARAKVIRVLQRVITSLARR
jgi:hypothetical protein